MEAAAAGEAHFENGERLVAIVAKAILSVDVNERLQIGRELNADFLLVDDIPGTK
jgi:hypothetical protein